MTEGEQSALAISVATLGKYFGCLYGHCISVQLNLTYSTSRWATGEGSGIPGFSHV